MRSQPETFCEVPHTLRPCGERKNRAAASKEASHEKGGVMADGMPEYRAQDTSAKSLWALASAQGMDRRRFLALMVAGGTAAVLAACFGGMQPDQTASSQTGTAPSPDSHWFKDPEPFIRHGDKGLEARLEHMQGLITSNSQFFVRNNSVSLGLDASSWRLAVEGDAISQPQQFSYNQIMQMPSRTLTCYLECAGNHRAMFDKVQGRKASGTQWLTGGVSNGEWAGVPLRTVLEMAGIKSDAVSVLLVGLDSESPEEGFRYVLPIVKAIHPDTLLAYSLNGETLPRDHGFPIRVLVPGWVGSANIKWLGRIFVSSRPLWTRNNTTSYVLIGDRYPAQGQAQGTPVTRQVIKSALALPWPATLPSGRHRIYGYAHSPDGPIARVEWSDDSGQTWSQGELSGSQPDYSWARFEFAWNAVPGEQTLMIRATDTANNTQPDLVPFNEKGYLFNQPLPHPLRIV